MLPSRIFYGWYITLACGTFMFVAVGVGYYGLGLFLGPLQTDHGWSSSAVSSATGMYFLVAGVASFAAGPYIDRYGPRTFMSVGIAMTALGVMAIGFVTSLWQLYAVYTFMALAYGSGTAIGVNTILTKWFVHRRAKAMSISSTGVSLGGAFLVPVGTVLLDRGGLMLATPVLGALVLIVAVPMVYLVLVPDPQAMGLKPDGDHIVVPAANIRMGDQQRSWARAEAARTVTFWAILIGFSLVLASQTAVIIHQLKLLGQADKLGSTGAAAAAVTVTTIGSVVARLIVGQFADRIDKRLFTVALFAVQAVAILGYRMADGTVAIYLFALVFGFTIGNVYMMWSLLTGESFGMRSFGSIYGVFQLTGQLGAGVGLIAMGILVDRTGGYSTPLTIWAAADVAAAASIYFARPVRDGR